MKLDIMNHLNLHLADGVDCFVVLSTLALAQNAATSSDVGQKTPFLHASFPNLRPSTISLFCNSHNASNGLKAKAGMWSVELLSVVENSIVR